MKCKICQTEELKRIADLGDHPLSNEFRKDQFWDKYPLRLGYCPQCMLVQLEEFVDYSRLFSEYYYHTGASFPMRSHFMELVDVDIINMIKFTPGKYLDIGCNDGTLIGFVSMDERIKCIGVEPSLNIFESLEKRFSKRDDITIYNDFFNQKLAERIKRYEGQMDVITACNVLAHVHDPLDFLKGIELLLSDDGCCLIEVQYAKQILEDGVFDQIYHEHCYYFTLTSLNLLIEKAGLIMTGYSLLNVHGSTLRASIRKKWSTGAHVERFMDNERKSGLFDEHVYMNLQNKIDLNIDKIKTIINRFDTKLIGYGAPAKSSVLLNTIPELKDKIDICIDTTDIKDGCFIPGTNIKITDRPLNVISKNTDPIFLFAWNYMDYIVDKEKLYNAQRKIVIPFPEPKVLF